MRQRHAELPMRSRVVPLSIKMLNSHEIELHNLRGMIAQNVIIVEEQTRCHLSKSGFSSPLPKVLPHWL